ncbi:hypothetical protein Tco_1370326 [Tanacetum coccineum]
MQTLHPVTNLVGTSSFSSFVTTVIPPCKIDKTLCFIKEPVEIMDCDVTSLKRGRIPIVKVQWNSKRGPKFTWEREEYMESKYPQLFVDRVDDQTS